MAIRNCKFKQGLYLLVLLFCYFFVNVISRAKQSLLDPVLGSLHCL